MKAVAAKYDYSQIYLVRALRKSHIVGKQLNKPKAFDQQLEELMLGERDLPAIPRVGVLMLLPTVLTYVRASIVYRRGGFPSAHKHLADLQHTYGQLGDMSAQQQWRIAKGAFTTLAVVSRLIRESSNCLEVAVPLTAALIRLGLDAHLVIAKAPPFADVQFHAWTEVKGMSVMDDPAIVTGYSVLMKHPSEI